MFHKPVKEWCPFQSHPKTQQFAFARKTGVLYYFRNVSKKITSRLATYFSPPQILFYNSLFERQQMGYQERVRSFCTTLETYTIFKFTDTKRRNISSCGFLVYKGYFYNHIHLKRTVSCKLWAYIFKVCIYIMLLMRITNILLCYDKVCELSVMFVHLVFGHYLPYLQMRFFCHNLFVVSSAVVLAHFQCLSISHICRKLLLTSYCIVVIRTQSTCYYIYDTA